MTDIKMSELLDLPVDCHDIESKITILRSSDLQALSDKVNAYDANQERIKELEKQISTIKKALRMIEPKGNDGTIKREFYKAAVVKCITIVETLAPED